MIWISNKFFIVKYSKNKINFSFFFFLNFQTNLQTLEIQHILVDGLIYQLVLMDQSSSIDVQSQFVESHLNDRRFRARSWKERNENEDLNEKFENNYFGFHFNQEKETYLWWWIIEGTTLFEMLDMFFFVLLFRKEKKEISTLNQKIESNQFNQNQTKQPYLWMNFEIGKEKKFLDLCNTLNDKLNSMVPRLRSEIQGQTRMGIF